MASATSPVRSLQRDSNAEGVSSQGRQRKTSLGHRSTAHAPSGSGAVPASASSRYQSSTNLTSATSSSSTTIRRQSLFGTDDRVVLDIGSRVTRIGFSGEARPRDTFRTMEAASPSSQITAFTVEDALWTPNLLRCRNDEERKLIESQLRAKLTAVLRSIFYQRLLVDPKQRKVIVVEGALMPTMVKRTICDVLFGNLQVPLVTFVASHLVSTLAIGRMASMVLDLGYHEAVLLPVQFGRVLTASHLLTSPRSGRRLLMRLRALLLHFASFVPAPTNGNFSSSQSSSSSAVKSRVSAEMLTIDFLEEVVAQALFVGEIVVDGKEEEITEADASSQGVEGPPDWTRGEQFAEADEEKDVVLMRSLKNRYRPHSKARDMSISLPPLTREPITPVSRPSTIGSAAAAFASGRGAILVPGWVRERAAEVLFERGDEDQLSLDDLILKTLIKLPIDLRTTLASNIYVVGGVAMLPGLAHRLRIEVVKRLGLAASREEGLRRAMVALTLPRVGSIVSPRRAPTFLDEGSRPIDTILEHQEASAAGTCERSAARTPFLLESKEMKERRRVREEAEYAPLAALAPVVAVLNDHAPRIDSQGRPVGGSAPSFPVNLSSWIGASLMGSLRVEAVDQKSREAWDEEQELIEAAKAAKNRKKKSDLERPGLGAGRGSFLGTVGGLDLGTYGPLSAARGTFSGASNPRSPSLS